MIIGSISQMLAVGCGAQDRAQLRTKDLGLIEADADRAPAQERIRFVRRLERRRELVAAEVVGADHDRVAGERGCRPGGNTRSVRLRSGMLVRPVIRNSVRSSPTPWAPCRTATSTSSGRSTLPCSVIAAPSGVTCRFGGNAFELQFQAVPAHCLQAGRFEFVGRRVEQDPAGLAVEQDDGAVGDARPARR